MRQVRGGWRRCRAGYLELAQPPARLVATATTWRVRRGSPAWRSGRTAAADLCRLALDDDRDAWGGRDRVLHLEWSWRGVVVAGCLAQVELRRFVSFDPFIPTLLAERPIPNSNTNSEGGEIRAGVKLINIYTSRMKLQRLFIL